MSEKMTNIGRRVKLITMFDDLDPVESGTLGTVYHEGGGVLNVNWDNGRKLGLVQGTDIFVYIT